MEEEPEGSSKGENTLPRARSTARHRWVMCNWQERPSGTFPAGHGAALSFLPPHVALSWGPRAEGEYKHHVSPWRPLSGLPAVVTGHYCTRMLRFRTRKSLSYTHRTASSPFLKTPLVCKQCVGKTRGESLNRRRDGGGDVTQMGNSPQSALAPEVRSVSWDAWPAAAWK